MTKIRKAFFDVVIELFQKYKEFVYLDPFGQMQFNVKHFIKASPKKYQ